MSKMKAVGLYRYLPIENDESLIDIELEKPTPSGRDILVHVAAVSVNPVDTKQRAPKDKVEQTPRVLGYDAAGTVVAVGDEVTLFHVGDEVYYAGDITRQGTNSEYHLVDERIVAKKPTTLSFAQAAALPLTTITAWEAFYDRMNMAPNGNEGKTVLIIGAAGGVGSIATQLAREAGFTVIGTASREETIQWAKEHGANYVIDHRAPFAKQLQALGFGDGVDYILCCNSLEMHWEQMIEVARPQARLCSIIGPKTPVALGQLSDKSLSFSMEYMFTRAKHQTPDMQSQHDLLTAVAQMVDEGRIQTTMTECLSPIDAKNLKTAHAKLEEGRMIGKLVIEGFEP